MTRDRIWLRRLSTDHNAPDDLGIEIYVEGSCVKIFGKMTWREQEFIIQHLDEKDVGTIKEFLASVEKDWGIKFT